MKDSQWRLSFFFNLEFVLVLTPVEKTPLPLVSFILFFEKNLKVKKKDAAVSVVFYNAPLAVAYCHLYS
jgi:hypothetical protein